MVHPNAPLSPEGRWRLVRLIVEDGWSVARAAERLQVSRTTAYRWLGRYQQLGRAGLVDRPSRPHRMPRLTPASVVRKIAHLRTTRRWGRSPSAPGSVWPPPPSTASWSAWAATAWPGPTEPAGCRCAAMSIPTREAWSRSTSRSSAIFPKVAATGSTAARPAGALARPTGPAAG